MFFNTYNPNKPFSANHLNNKNLFNNMNLTNITDVEIKINNLSITNNSNVIASMNLTNTNTGLNNRGKYIK